MQPRSVLPPVTSPLIGQHTHAWPSTANHDKAVVLNLCIKLDTWHILFRCMTWWRGVSWAAFSAGEKSFCRCKVDKFDSGNHTVIGNENNVDPVARDTLNNGKVRWRGKTERLKAKKETWRNGDKMFSLPCLTFEQCWSCRRCRSKERRFHAKLNVKWI